MNQGFEHPVFTLSKSKNITRKCRLFMDYGRAQHSTIVMYYNEY